MKTEQIIIILAIVFFTFALIYGGYCYIYNNYIYNENENKIISLILEDIYNSNSTRLNPTPPYPPSYLKR